MTSRNGHHATSEHDFTSDETEFLMAIDRFKVQTGKKFPTWLDVMAVFRSLGYHKDEPEESILQALEDDDAEMLALDQ